MNATVQLGSTQNSTKPGTIDKNPLKNTSSTTNNPHTLAAGSNHIYGASRGALLS